MLVAAGSALLLLLLLETFCSVSFSLADRGLFFVLIRRRLLWPIYEHLGVAAWLKSGYHCAWTDPLFLDIPPGCREFDARTRSATLLFLSRNEHPWNIADPLRGEFLAIEKGTGSGNRIVF